MVTNFKITAIIPIRHYSSRVKGKNYRLMNNKPLFHYILETLTKTKYITDIIVDTNSPIVIEGIKEHFPHINIYNRPENLCDGNISTNLLFMNVIEQMGLQSDYYFQTHATNPLLKAKTIDDSIKRFLDSDYESMFSVKQHQTRLYWKDGKAINHNPKELLPTQDLDPIYEENSCFYMFTKESLFKYQHRIADKAMMIPISDFESQDIDIEFDFQLTEIMMRDAENMNMNKEQFVLITGASGGIGLETASYFVKKGWKVIGMDITKPEKEFFTDFYMIDITDSESIKNSIDDISKKYKKINCLVNNAAIQICKKVVDMTNEDWDRQYNCNIKAAFCLSRECHKLLKKCNGSIVNVSSVHSTTTSECISAYASTKGALSAFTRACSLEYARDKIRVNEVRPGATNTEMLRNGLVRDHVEGSNIKECLDDLGSKHILNRIARPMEIAKAIYFLADNNQSSFMIGQSIVVDGGATIRLSTE